MYEKEILKLENEIDELSPRLAFLEKQMREKVHKLYCYQEKKYKLEYERRSENGTKTV